MNKLLLILIIILIIICILIFLVILPLTCKWPFRFNYKKESMINMSFPITITHEPKNDQVGAFITPSIFLFAIADYNGWKYHITPYLESQGYKTMKNNIKLGNKIDKGWGTGIQDSNYNKSYNPIDTNLKVYDELGFFPKNQVSNKSRKWTKLHTIESSIKGFIKLPSDPIPLQKYMENTGGIDKYFNPDFLSRIRKIYRKKNKSKHNLYRSEDFNVILHIRRGDVNDPNRITALSVFINIIKEIKKKIPKAKFYIFSAGKNKEGWDDFLKLGCHLKLDTDIFDSWYIMTMANILVICRSNFGYIPAILCTGKVLYNKGWWHPKLKNWIDYNNKTGNFDSRRLLN